MGTETGVDFDYECVFLVFYEYESCFWGFLSAQTDTFAC